MRISINTRGAGTLEFWAPDGGGYVRLESPGRPGTLGRQICHGGGFYGETVRCGPSVESLARAARAWRRQMRDRD